MDGKDPEGTPPRPLGAHTDLTHPGGPLAPRPRRPRRKGSGAAVALGLLVAAVTFAVHFVLWFGSCVTGCAGQNLSWFFLAWLAPLAYVVLVVRKGVPAGRAALVAFCVLGAFLAAVLLM